MTEAERRIADGSAWRDFCRSLERAGEAVLQPGTPTDPFQRAEGYRYLTRLLRAGLESHIESADPHHPRFYQLANETIKIGNDNPDNLYHNANVAGALEYRIRGKRGTVPYLSFMSACGGYEGGGDQGGEDEGGRNEGDATLAHTGQLDAEDIACAEDGSFEIIASATEQAQNWLPMRANTTTLIVRQTFADRIRELPAHYTIECIAPTRSDTLRAEDLGPALLRTAAFVEGTARLFVDWMKRFAEHTNTLPPNDQQMCIRAGGDANIHYHNSRWRLAPEEALLIELTPPRCTTWNLQIGNFWMESLDYRSHRIHVNKTTAHYEPDGSVRIVVAHRDPGDRFPNWLETCDHHEGSMLFRYVGATDYPPISTRVVTDSELCGL